MSLNQLIAKISVGCISTFVFGFYGRSGHGVETAVKAFSRACFLSGFYCQSFAFIGRGRRVFPVTGFVKVDKSPIESKQVEEPDFYVVMDPTLGLEAKQMDAKGVMQPSFKEKSIVIFNSPEKLSFPALKKRRVRSYFVDATGIALSRLRSNTPNTAMLGALTKVFTKVSIKNMKAALEQLPKDNFAAFDEGYKTVR